VLHLIVEKVRATLKKRKDTSGEDWREEQGYR
jgi:hypothetical protein